MRGECVGLRRQREERPATALSGVSGRHPLKAVSRYRLPPQSNTGAAHARRVCRTAPAEGGTTGDGAFRSERKSRPKAVSRYRLPPQSDTGAALARRVCRTAPAEGGTTGDGAFRGERTFTPPKRCHASACHRSPIQGHPMRDAVLGMAPGKRLNQDESTLAAT
jgi:hypothetical protein